MKEAPEIDDSRGFQNFLLILVRGRLVLDLPIDGTDDKHPVQRPFYSHSMVKNCLQFVPVCCSLSQFVPFASSLKNGRESMGSNLGHGFRGGAGRFRGPRWVTICSWIKRRTHYEAKVYRAKNGLLDQLEVHLVEINGVSHRSQLFQEAEFPIICSGIYDALKIGGDFDSFICEDGDVLSAQPTDKVSRFEDDILSCPGLC